MDSPYHLCPQILPYTLYQTIVLVIASIGEILFQTRPDQEEEAEEEYLVQPVFCIVDTGSCYDWLSTFARNFLKFKFMSIGVL